MFGYSIGHDKNKITLFGEGEVRERVVHVVEYREGGWECRTCSAHECIHVEFVKDLTGGVLPPSKVIEVKPYKWEPKELSPVFKGFLTGNSKLAKLLRRK